MDTLTDHNTSRWHIDGRVVRLREWGTDQSVSLDRPQLILGSSNRYSLQIPRPGVSRRHLRLDRTATGWKGTDLGSKNGTYVDGVRMETFSVTSGCQLRIGGVTLIAESPRWIALRGFLFRILGWTEVQAVDLALHSVRRAALYGDALHLNGDGDLVRIAAGLHRYIRTKDSPFVTCDPRRAEGDASARCAINKPTWAEALAAAVDGTVCLQAYRMPGDFRSMTYPRAPSRAFLTIVNRVQNTIDLEYDDTRNPAINVPALQTRVHELSALIDAYAEDAADHLSLPRQLLTVDDLAWLAQHAATSIPEVETTTLRMLALRGSSSLPKAAARLGMHPVSLTNWIGRRRFPEWVRKMQVSHPRKYPLGCDHVRATHEDASTTTQAAPERQATSAQPGAC